MFLGLSSSVGKREKKWNILMTATGEVSQEWWGSQDHRMAEVGRDLWKSPAPRPLLEQGHPEQAALCRGSFWLSSRWGTLPWLFFPIYLISSPGCFLNCWARCKLKLLASSVSWNDPLGCRWTPVLMQGRHQDCPPKRRGEGATPFHSSKLLAQLTHLVKCHLKGMRQKLTVQRS